MMIKGELFYIMQMNGGVLSGVVKQHLILETENIYFHVPRPNSSILFPGIIPHAAESPSRGFPGLRITIAWKLLIKEQ